MSASHVRALAGALGRRWWIALTAFALVAVVALVRYAGPGSAARHRYLSSQTLTVSVLPPDGGGAYAAMLAQQTADNLGGQITLPAVLSAGDFDRAVAAQVAADRSEVAARFGAQAAARLAGLSADVVSGALTANHTDDQVSLTARWPTPAGAWALATAAGQVLNANPALIPPASPGLADGASVRIVLDGSATAPTLDPGPEQAARARLAETLVLGLILGVGLALLVAVWETRRSPKPVPSPDVTPSEERSRREARPQARVGSE